MHGVLLTAGLCLLLATTASSTRMVCVYDRVASTRVDFGQFTPAMIDPTLCTHIIFSSANIETQEVVPFDSNDTALYAQLNSLKNSNPQLKTLLSVGGPGFNNQRFSAAVSSANNRNRFITSAKALIKNNGFNGIHLDWRYPGGAGSQPMDPTRFLSLCQELRAEFDKEVPALLVSASVSAVRATIDSSYPDPSALASAMDFINVLTFNFHNPSESNTAHHSPLGALSSNPSDTLTTEFAMNYWSTTLGVPADKLNVGFAAFGVAFRLANANTNGVDAATSTLAPEEGCYTGQPGVWSYYETCIYIVGGATRRIPSQSVPYTVTEGHWVGYDDRLSINA
ncbi:hypothetical protein NQD34_005677 [Periophthalmus magnuspinnatus]|nr:hypothetical protein NQD34_005677 [Periophthalmus magnuspinnatus]